MTGMCFKTAPFSTVFRLLCPMVRGTETGRVLCHIPDCVFHEMDQIYYAIDMVCWKSYSYYNCTAEFKFTWFESKLAETKARDPPSYYHKYRFSLVPWYDGDLSGLHKAYTGEVPYCFITGNTPLALVWKDEHCSQYVIDTDNKGQVPSHQQVVLELQDDGLMEN